MKNKLIRNISIIVFIMVIMGIMIIPKLGSKKETDSPRAQMRGGSAISVDIQVIEASKFQNKIQVSGTTLSNEEVELRTETSGKIINIFFKEGQKVQKGGLLLKVNDADLQAQLQKAEIKKKLAEEKEYRQKVLLSKNGTSQELYDTALNDLNSAKADIDNLKALIAKTEIRAPFDGTIGLRYVSEGSYVTPSTQIASLQSLNPIKIDFSVPQRYASAISVGSKVKIRASSGKEYQVKIYALEKKIDPATRALKVRAVYPNQNNELLPGSYVTVDINLNDINNAITIPTQALALDISGEIVYIYQAGKVVPRKVESSVRSESDVQIVKGLAVGDTIITSGIIQIRPGSKVKIAGTVQNKNSEEKL
jgi:membrane fusion protein, multidrug efflux system